MAGNESNESGQQIPGVNACESFGRGHQTHWIMWKRYQDKTEPGRVLGFEQDLVVVRLFDGAVRRWWHHQPERLRVVVERFGPDVRVVPGLPALVCGGYWFYCADLDHGRSPCSIQQPASRSTLRRWLRGELWRGRDSLAVTYGWGRTTLTRRYDAPTGCVHLTCAVPDMDVPQRDRRRTGVYGSWAPGRDGGADLTVALALRRAFEAYREELVSAAAADLVRTALDESAGAPARRTTPSRDSPARSALPLIQDQLLWDLPGWYFEHEELRSVGELGSRGRMVIAVETGRWLGEGIRIDVELPGVPTAPAGSPGSTSFGAWALGENGVRYSAFLSNDLLAAVPDHPASSAFLSSVMSGVADTVRDALDGS